MLLKKGQIIMMMCEESQSKFEIFLDKYNELISTDLNESETRSKIIDYILKDVLGWDELDIKREEKIQSGYYDYLVQSSNLSFIIEAKKNYKEFAIPNNHKNSSINALYSSNRDMFDQIRHYIYDKGLQYGVLTNGKQFLLTRFVNTDGSDWKKNECKIYNGFEDLTKRFTEFYNDLSKYSYSNGSGFNTNTDKKKNYSILLAQLPNKDGEIFRNSLVSAIASTIDKIFGEIFANGIDSNDDDFIKKCFVENENIKQYKDSISKLFIDKPPSSINPVMNYSSLK